MDDLLLDFAGEDNSRRACNYDWTEVGNHALREAADPERFHTYAWFVMTDCNTPDEQIYRDLTLEEAVRLYRDSTRPENGWPLPRMVLPLSTSYGKRLESRYSSRTTGEWTAFAMEIFEAVQMIHRELE